MYKPRAVVRLVQRLGSFAAQIRRASYSQRFAAGKVYGRLPCGEGCPGATAWDGPGRIRGTNGRETGIQDGIRDTTRRTGYWDVGIRDMGPRCALSGGRKSLVSPRGPKVRACGDLVRTGIA